MKRYGLEESIDVVRTNKRLVSNNERLRKALEELVEATSTSPVITDSQKSALDKAIIALSY